MKERREKIVKKRISVVLLTIFLMLAITSIAMAAGAEKEVKGLSNEVKMFIALASGLGIAIAAFGGALGQGRSIAAALEGIARNPGASGKLLTPMIIGLAMIESLVIYSLVVSLMLVMKL